MAKSNLGFPESFVLDDKDKGFIDIENTISRFPEGERLLLKKAELTKELKKVRRRLRTQKARYSFLKRMIETQDSTVLEIAIKDYFRSLGFKAVHKGNDTSREDVQVWVEGKVYILECKNHTTGNATREDISQLSHRRANIHDLPEFEGKKLVFIGVINNQCSRPLKNRDSNPLSTENEKTLKHDKNSIVTTKSLYDAFVAIKRNKLTLNGFENKLNQIGLIEF